MKNTPDHSWDSLETLKNQIAIITERTKFGGEGIPVEVHQANSATFSLKVLRDFGLLDDMVKIVLDALSTRHWRKAKRVLGMVTPNQDFANLPAIRDKILQSYDAAIKKSDLSAKKEIRELAPWIKTEVARPIGNAVKKKISHVLVSEPTELQRNLAKTETRERLSKILTLDPGYRHTVLPEDPAVQTLEKWEKEFADHPRELEKIRNLRIVDVNGKRGLQIDTIESTHFHSCHLLNFTVDMEIERHPKKTAGTSRQGMTTDPEGNPLFTFHAAEKWIGRDMLRDYEFEEFILGKMPGKHHEADVLFKVRRFIELFHLPATRGWDTEKKEFDQNAYFQFWTDFDAIEWDCEGQLLMLSPDSSHKSLYSIVCSGTGSIGSDMFPAFRVLNRGTIRRGDGAKFERPTNR